MLTRLTVPTDSRVCLVDITTQVQRVVGESGVKQGVCHLFVPHTTAGVLINENWDPSVRQDIIAVLERMVPESLPYRHREGNAPAHVKASLVGASQTCLIDGGQLILGSWQGIFLAEFDGPRRRTVWVHVVSD